MSSYRRKKALLKEYDKSEETPIINARTFDFSNQFSKIKLCFIGDVHKGSSDSDIEGLIDNLRYAAQEDNVLVFLLGDMMNYAILGSKSNVYEEVLPPQKQLDGLIDIMNSFLGNSEVAPYINKLLTENRITLPEGSLKHFGKDRNSKIATINEGNHESRVSKAVGISPTKIVADATGMSEAYSPYYSNTEIKLKNNFGDEDISYRVFSHHGTGNNKIDDMINKYTLQVNNADLYVMGHIHDYSVTAQRVLRIVADEKTGHDKQMYMDQMFLTVPASGGGSYYAGMSMVKKHRQTGVWVEIEPQLNPMANRISSTGVSYPKYVVAPSFISPDIPNELKKKPEKPVRQAANAIKKLTEANLVDLINENIINTLDAIDEFHGDLTSAIISAIQVKPLKEPKGFKEYYEQKQKIKNPNDASVYSAKENTTDEEMQR